MSKQQQEKKMDMAESIDALELSVRCQKVLNNMGVKTIGCILGRAYQDFAGQKGMGKKTMEDLADALGIYGMRIPQTPIENWIQKTPKSILVEMSLNETRLLIQCPLCLAPPGHVCGEFASWSYNWPFCSERNSLSEKLLLEKIGDKVSLAFERFWDAQEIFEAAQKELRSTKKVLSEMSPCVKEAYLQQARAEERRAEEARRGRIEEIRSRPNITVSNEDGSVSKVRAFSGETVAQFWYPTTGEEDVSK